MWTSSNAIPLLRKAPILIACCLLLIWCTPVPGQEHSPNSAVTEVVERDASKLLSDSDWAHSVKPTLQDTPCTYQNAVFSDLYPTEQAFRLDAPAPTRPPDPVKADDSEYLVRFQSAKPVQTAVQELLAMGGGMVCLPHKRMAGEQRLWSNKFAERMVQRRGPDHHCGDLEAVRSGRYEFVQLWVRGQRTRNSRISVA